MSRFKKVLAVVLGTTLALGSSLTAFASSGDTWTGNGDVEGWVNKKVITIDVPTDAATSLAFSLDPQGLAAATQGGKHGDVDIDANATVLFKYADATTDPEAKAKYGATSKSIALKNYSAIPVDLSVKVKVSDATGIKLVNSSTFGESKTADLYLAVVGNSGEEGAAATTALTAEDQTITKALDEAPAAAFVTEYDASEGYTFSLIDDEDDLAALTFSDYTFTVTGAANPNGDWSELTEAAPKLSIVYSAVAQDAEEDDPYADATAVTLIKGATTVYGMYADLPFAKADITGTKVKVDDADYADIAEVGNDSAIKFANDSAWETATSVVIYIIAGDDIYKYTFK